MKLLTFDEMENWVSQICWVRVEGRTLNPIVPVRAFRGTYEPAGVVAANMTELFLRKFARDPISGGILNVCGIVPPDRAPIQIFRHFLDLYGFPGVQASNFRCIFSNEYERVLTTLTWCLACGWEADFVADDRKLALRTDEDYGLTVLWVPGVEIAETGMEMLTNLEFVEVGSARGAWS